MDRYYDVLPENILRVDSPKYTESGVKLEYYEDKSN